MPRGWAAHPVSLEELTLAYQREQLTTYQPDSRFWPFQWIEGGWLLALSLLLLSTTIWLAHRRAA